MQTKVIYIMGVSGSGKTTIGELIAGHLGIPFYDGDQFHSEKNVAKMSAGNPLTDEDRGGWLQSIYEFAYQHLKTQSLVIACSALKEDYRKVLNGDIPKDGKIWIYLSCDYETLHKRMESRTHFMPASLLQSQFETLEEPIADLKVDMEETLEKASAEVIAFLNDM